MNNLQLRQYLEQFPDTLNVITQCREFGDEIITEAVVRFRNHNPEMGEVLLLQ